MREIFTKIGWERKVAVFGAAVLILSVLGPFGTLDDMSTLIRLMYFTIMLSGVGFFMHVIINVMLRTRGLGRLSQAWRVLIGSLTAALPGMAVVFFVDGVFRPPLIMPEAENLFQFWIQIGVIAYAIGIVEYIEWGQEPEEAAPPTTAFHRRLRDSLGPDIVSLSMMDHYVEVTTTKGKQMILMRFSDALHELRDFPGMRIHRSHYVSLRHGQRVRKSGNKHLLELSDGRSLPVSKTYLAELREALPIPPRKAA